MNTAPIQYISNENGQKTAVIVPIEIWQQLLAEQETTYLLKSPAMKQRLLAARQRQQGISLEDACEKLGV